MEQLGLDIDAKEESQFNLLSSDGREFTMNTQTAQLSKHLQNVLSNDKDAKRIELANVDGEILALIVEYMNYHSTNGRSPNDIKEISKPIRSLQMKHICNDPWDAEFADRMTNTQIFQIILAANYVQIDSLLNLFCAKMATLIKDQSHDQIRKVFACSNVDLSQNKADAESHGVAQQ